MQHLLTITGTTASGKTRLAVELAYRLGGEVISADSRQVFRGMDIGTGKDLQDYHGVHGTDIPYHLIDIRDAGEEYNLYQFLTDFAHAMDDIVSRGRRPILCGGTGMYIDAVVRRYSLPDAPIDPEFRQSLENLSDQQLTERLAQLIHLHNHTDTEDRARLIRALEIAEYRLAHPDSFTQMPEMTHTVVAPLFERSEIIRRIELRLRQRLQEGMVEEVRQLLDSGTPVERLLRYGLEYKHLTLYLTGQCSYDEMFSNLFTDIRRFAKRQMTWLRRMERNGVNIHWIDGTLPFDQQIEQVLQHIP